MPGPVTKPRQPATQASLALSADGRRWVLVNASPDLRQQIERNACLHPFEGLRSSPIAAVVLTNADVDAVAGLLHLREGTPFALYAHERVHQVLDRNPIFEVVNRGIVPRRSLEVEVAFAVEDAGGESLGMDVTPFLAPGKVPLYLEGGAEREIDTAAMDGDTLGLDLSVGGTASRLSRELRADHRPAIGAGGWRRRSLSRRHAVARRRDDRPGRRPEDGATDGPYQHERPGRRHRALARRSRSAAASSSTSTTPIPRCWPTAPSAPSSSGRGGKSPSTAWSSACDRRPLRQSAERRRARGGAARDRRRALPYPAPVPPAACTPAS